MASDDAHDPYPMTLPMPNRVRRAGGRRLEHTFRWGELRLTLRLERHRIELVIDRPERIA
ncbi:MAG: hypothetical protein K1X74_17370 [Pirellulales bacterium]|nr:hypothetical protein [Pirellulales bacterium]